MRLSATHLVEPCVSRVAKGLLALHFVHVVQTTPIPRPLPLLVGEASHRWHRRADLFGHFVGVGESVLHQLLEFLKQNRLYFATLTRIFDIKIKLNE